MNPTDLRPDLPERDLCDELLAPAAPPSDLAPLRELVLGRTLRRLRMRRYLRRGALVAALAACWVGGMLTMRWLSPPTLPQQHVPEIGHNQPLPVEPRPEAAPSAQALEWKAVDGAREQQAALYHKAADAFLTEERDPLSAVRCYRGALDAAPEQVQTISPDDEWLLMAIKDARKKEKRNAKTID
jgi:hypothetical protein